jgi:tRNA(Ile)-lysidine synthase
MNRFQETIKKYGLIQRGDKILVAVSGGPDSLALLLQLFGLKSKLGLTLHIAHVDHMSRRDSSLDAHFVESLAKKLKLPVSLAKLNPKLSQSKGSLEEIYREARLAFFIQTAKKVKADKVALGHNLDDQAETVLMRVLRGTGLSGLTGISAKRSLHGVVFIRPLLETTRREIDKFLKSRSIKPRIDSTNRQNLFLRNKIRHNLVPLLKKEYNKNIVQVLANLAESISYDYEYLDQVARSTASGSSLRLNLKKIRLLHPAILRLKIRQSIAGIQGDTRRISFVHIQEIEGLLNSRPDKSIVDLPKGISVQKTRNYLRFYKR